MFARLQPSSQFEIEALQNQRVLRLDDGRRVFLARVSRVRGTYLLKAGFFARVIGQYVTTTRDPLLYHETVDPLSKTFSGSGLIAYKINWQSVLFVGYGDDREFSPGAGLAPASRQFFVKMSYAFQR